MPVRANAESVRATTDEVSAARAADFLRQLRPLVVEEDIGFRVFHNDVRVFLQRILQADSAIYRDCASRLADHILVGPDARARHAAVQNLLGIAQRGADQAALFSPAYVLEGHAVGCSLGELTEQVPLIAAEALSGVEADWSLAHSCCWTACEPCNNFAVHLSGRVMTVAARWLMRPFVSTLPAERRVTPLADWDADLLLAGAR